MPIRGLFIILTMICFGLTPSGCGQAGFSLVDLPKGMPDEVFQDIGKARVCGRRVQISRWEKTGEKGKGG